MLQPYIHHTFKSAVWRLEIDALNEVIFAEIRSSADKKVYFASLSLKDGSVFFDDLQTEERWLTGMEAACNQVLLLHNYTSESGPEHKGLIAIDALTGRVLWSNYTHAFDHLSVSGAVIYDTRLQPRKLFLADIKTGEIIRPFEPLIDTHAVIDIILPHIVPVNILNIPQIPVAPLGNTMHYLEHNNFRIVSLHSFATGALQQYLYILKGGDIVYEDLLNTDIQKLQPESFLIHKEQLIYLKNQTQLKVLNL